MNAFRILSKQIIAPDIKRMDVVATMIVQKAHPGQFVVVMPDEKSQRLALPIVEASMQKSAITLIFKERGPAEKALGSLAIGENLYAVLGPLGNPALEESEGIVVCIGYELGIAQTLSLCRHFQKKGNKVFSILGASTRKSLILEPAMRVACHSVFVATLDGSAGKKVSVEDALDEIVSTHAVSHVYVAAPTDAMQAVVVLCAQYKIKVSVVVQPRALSGIGFCGTDIVKVGHSYVSLNKEGPIFDGTCFDFDAYRLRDSGELSDE